MTTDNKTAATKPDSIELLIEDLRRTGHPLTAERLSALTLTAGGWLVPEIECRRALRSFMEDWNVLPPAECAELLARRLKNLSSEVA